MWNRKCGTVTGGRTIAEGSGEISNMTVIGIGIILFLAIIGIWYVVLR